MEFLPIEKYSLDRKTGKHKKDVTKIQRKAVIKELKAEGKVKTKKVATPVKTPKAKTEKQKSKPVLQRNKGVKAKGKAAQEKSEAVKEKNKTEKVISPAVEKQRERIRAALTKNVPDNRLFVNMKKKILNVQEVRDLHPDIISVTMPRRKCSSWCWAVFDSKAKAIKALKVLKEKDDIIVSHGVSEENKKEKREKEMKKVKLKKAIKKTLRDTWM